MAQVAPATHQRIDHLLSRSTAEWNELPEVEAEIDSWDQMDQIDFVEEWTLAEERLLQLARFANSETFTEDQQERYDQLLQVVARYRPIIVRLRTS